MVKIENFFSKKEKEAQKREQKKKKKHKKGNRKRKRRFSMTCLVYSLFPQQLAVRIFLGRPEEQVHNDSQETIMH